MAIPFTAPQSEYEAIRDEWLQAVEAIARSGVFVGGPPVAAFEEAFARYAGTAGAVGVGNGTDALFLALTALGIGPGDEVITCAHTFIATVSAIYHTGARPVLADTEPDGFLIDRAQVEALATPRTKAIVPVHLYGEMVDLRELCPWAQARGIDVVEDCAQAVGARLDGQPAGSWGAMGCFSFYPDKNLGALGDGGAIVASSDRTLARLRQLRNHGGEVRYKHDIPGFNSRLDAVQASALLLKLRRLDEWTERRIAIAGLYARQLAGIDFIRLPEAPEDGRHVFHAYVVRVANGQRDALKKHLQKKGILTGIQYPVPVHLTPAYACLDYPAGSFPRAEQLAGELLSLPMHIAMTEQSVATVCAEIRSFAEAHRSQCRRELHDDCRHP